MELPVLKQSPVTFISGTHQYLLGDKELKGITTTLVRRAYPKTYEKPDNFTDEEWQAKLDDAKAKGSVMHETIELHDELGVDSDLPELQSYIRIKEAHHLQVVATEYIVSDEEHYATAIDKVMMTEGGRIILVDFKRTSEIHIEDVTCQLSICKRFFEMQNPDLKVDGIYLMWLRDEQSKFQALRPWADESLDLLIKSDIDDKEFDITQTYGDLPARFAEVESEIAAMEVQAKQIKEREEELKAGLYKLMEEHNVKKWSGPRIVLTRVLPTNKTTFDTKAFKADHEDLYKQYCKTSEAAGSLRIKLK